MTISFLGAVLVLQLLGVTVQAQQNSGVTNAEREKIVTLRGNIKAALVSGDRAKLERLYHRDYFHVHAIGRVDDRAKRFEVLLSGEVTVDRFDTRSISMRKLNKATIVDISITTVTETEKPNAEYTVTSVFIMSDGRWQLASTHASAVVK